MAIFMLLPATGFAQVNATSDYLARMDGDGDGRVSQGEYLDWMSYAFDARDSNRDGVLTADELPGGKGQAITRQQHRERLAATFKKQDVDRDGSLSAKELAAPPQ
jgi:Ca2+-binding EF-hand superfamily protein